MDPISALSIAAGIVAFVDFGAKLVSLYLEIQESEHGRPAALSALDTESRELSGNASHARDKVASLQARYPRQSESLARLAAECAQAEKDLWSLTDSLRVKPGHGLRARGSLALVAIRGMLKQGDVEALQGRLRSIREQTMMSVIMCISGVGEVLDILRPMKMTIDNLQPEFHNISRSRPLASELERHRVAGGLWTSIATTDQPDSQTSLGHIDKPLQNDSDINNRILRGLELKDMTARERQIENAFPETFQWLLDDDDGPESGKSSARPPTKFKEWLESQANEAPFWITGNPASGKSTLMKFICTQDQVQTHLRAWSGENRLLTCSVYLWNPGSSGQKSQVGLLSTIFHQLLRQRPDLCRVVASRRYLYFQLAGTDSPDPPDWTVEELRSCIALFVSQIEGSTDRLAIFVDGLDEYEGNLENLVSFLKQLHHGHKVKLCVSSRPWNVFKDEFRTYPSLRMELLTKPDIEKYVRTRMGSSPAFQELRKLYSASVDKLEFQIIGKADGVFLWVVLVVEKVIATARENNDLREIWTVFDSLPPGLEELYTSMRGRLDPTHREGAARMYQLLFRWNEILDRAFDAIEFWMAINCHDPTEVQPCLPEDQVPDMLPMLERRMAGATGGVLQVFGVDPPGGDPLPPSQRASVGFLHRTAFDWLQGMRSSIVNDGPASYDPGLALTSVFVSRLNRRSLVYKFPVRTNRSTVSIADLFAAGQSCNPSAESRSKLLGIIDQLRTDRLASYPDSTVRSYLATRFLCAPYLQAKLESSSHATGLEVPRKLHRVPTAFWYKPQKELVSHILGVVVGDELAGETCQTLNMRLKTFETLLQAQFAPRRYGSYPREYWQALQAGLEGKGFVELTNIATEGYGHSKRGSVAAYTRRGF
ncbi:hypothetical protein C8A00DRAFT_45022 [Chaetomidium leptoderma]|uniref:Nephrocystin 3-like N-terminal domain-containing protein n=1 Tax=Chaetomidium leptoderma TaxID=669021 RepID=A0AAN6ZVI6_9PEZI|nr:hypothetical protein C8A00DRAFT_45022 [Chaetomidium leptoderma]